MPAKLAALLEAPEAAHAARERAYQDKSAARTAWYDAERAYEEADKLRDAAGATRRAILRALLHRDEEPTTPEPEPYGIRRNERQYQTHRARASAYTGARHGRTAPSAYAYGWVDGETTPLYESARGTNDPAKLAAELDRADTLAREWIATQTARAYLRAQGIDPDTAPPVAQLVTVETTAAPRVNSWNGSRILTVEPEYALRLNSSAEIIATGRPWDVLDRATMDAARDAEPRTGRTLDDDEPAPRAQLADDTAAVAAYWNQYAAEALPRLIDRAR